MSTKKQLQAQQSELQIVKKQQSEVKTNAYNDINLKNWRDYNHIETGTLWNFATREKNNRHSYDYHGNYIPQIATQLYERYTKRYDVVLDMFLGSGTSAIEAVNMDRRCIGIELKKELCDYVDKKFSKKEKNKSVKIINGDSASDTIVNHINATLAGLEEKKAQFLILHPPYADIIKFSDNEKDLSNCISTNHFLKMFEKVAQNGYECLEKGHYAALIIGDKYEDGELTPLSFLCMQRMNKIGFKTKSIIVKNIEGNEKGKGKTANLWRYRALAGGFFIFKHEYIMLFQKK
ncbi:MAG: DNA methyltransferase [Candidatus Gastranaerophilaceae bacterium]